MSSSKEPESTASGKKGQTSRAQNFTPQQSPEVQLKTAEKKRKHESEDEDATCQDRKRAKISVQGEAAEGNQAKKCCPDRAS